MDMSYTQDVYTSHGTEYNRHAQHFNAVALYIDGCLGFHDILVYWNESMLYNFRKSNYVQQRKTYTRKGATVHLNCSIVPCNTLCARIAAAVWRKTRDVICDLQSARPWDAVPWYKTYPCQKILLHLEIEPWFLARQECRIDTVPTQVPCTGTYGTVVTEMKADSLHKFCLEIRKYSYCQPLSHLAMRQRFSRIDTTINASSPHPTTPKCTKGPQISMWEHVLELGRSIRCPSCRFWIYK
jgi:hypothetical protein